MKSFFVPLVLLFSGIIYHAESANILFFFGVATYSHRILVWPLVEAISERNHSVTFFQPDKNKNPNPKITEINPVVDGLAERYNVLKGRLKLGPRKLQLDVASQLPTIGLTMCEIFMNDQEIVNWIKNTKFDLIVIDTLFNECAYGIAHLHKAKVINFGVTHPFGWLADTFGFPLESYAFPELLFGMEMPLSFSNRVWATLSIFYMSKIRHDMFPKMEKVLREKLDIPDMPSIPEMLANTSLIFTNTHFSEELARSHPPSVVSIGGMAVKDRALLKPIPQDILEFIEGGDNGFILVSFGSGAKISDAPEELQEIFFNVFERTNMRFICKWEGERPTRMPENVMTLKWVPQQEVLAHPKIRAFISHGGLNSIHEALFHKVPMISIPVFAEQDYNSERLSRMKRGIRLEITTLTEEQLEDAIQRILEDDTYRQAVELTSKRFIDRPQKPLETAVWWTEYVLRHEDTSFMRPLGADLTWYQRRLLDVWAFFVAVILLAVYVHVKAFKFILGIFLNTDTHSAKVSNKHKTS